MKILRRLEDDFSLLICDCCLPNIYIYPGLEHACRWRTADGLEFAGDGIRPTLSFGHLNSTAR